MAAFGAAVCASVLLLVSLSSSCKDEHDCLQHEVTFEEIMREIQQHNSEMEQTEVDLGDLLDDELSVDKPRMVHPPTDTGPRGFVPRSFGGLPLDYPVQFPLGRPTPDNIQAICLHGDHRPRYPDSYFPRSYFSKQKRKAAAVNNAESWFSTCCKGNQTWGEEGTLCCATQAWEHSVKLFCEADSSVKDRLYKCCMETGNKRLNCFSQDSPNPNYEPTEELPVEPLHSPANFNFERAACSRNLMNPFNLRAAAANPSTPQIADINFPPGRPTKENIDSLCDNQMLRPLYTTKCLPSSGYKLLARQVKTINRLEKGFKHCCRVKVRALSCAKLKWRMEVNKYCSARMEDQAGFQCCVGKKGKDRHSCFRLSSPDPHYNATAATEEVPLGKICDTHKIIKNRFHVGFSLKAFVKQCCPLPEENKTNCLVQKLEEMSQSLCSSNKNHGPAVRRCCKTQSQEGISQCVSNIVTDAVSRATHIQRRKKKKICPLP
ncbi:extracellular matrix protein 1-like isoform X2 [Kryptolebias marmoratus]|uniref:Extracellular matrix protein 1b n=1 Tax=Kryptolebias marmoratus TaxID=37003 RepID=A0A3Q2ZKW4_KRYMA|nr:extracellular matrix protein 1-like isoform X2 [Kryptolebias marmoratus]